jgi:7-carboxy-7-deazaguanine synthase
MAQLVARLHGMQKVGGSTPPGSTKNAIIFLTSFLFHLIYMFGNNPKRPASLGDGQFLEVKAIFKTLQGEGPLVGVPSVFVRLGGCNLACKFCDTDFEDFTTLSKEEIIKQVELLSYNKENKRVIGLVVITGGEPLRQPIEALCKDLVDKGFMVQIETNGTLYRDVPSEVQIVCSPKSLTPIRDDLLKRLTAIKFLISTTNPKYDHVPDVGQDIYHTPVFLQPMDEGQKETNIANEQLAIEISLQKGYRLSYQLHKVLGIE